jgi:hypothetical protein
MKDSDGETERMVIFNRTWRRVSSSPTKEIESLQKLMVIWGTDQDVVIGPWSLLCSALQPDMGDKNS